MKFPFDELPNTAAITCCHILDENMPVLYVSHDEDDGMWQFLCGKSHDVSEARVVSLNSVFVLDNSIEKLAKMPCGYVAERENIKSEWVVKKR